jgi:hypothetical protein
MSAAGRLQPELSEECEQTPDEQVRLPLQVCPHPPQFLRSLEVSTQAPEHAEKPVSQLIPHFCAVQVATPCAGEAHAVVHAPQCAVSDVTSTH